MRAPKLIPENLINDLHGNENVGFLPLEQVEQLLSINQSSLWVFLRGYQPTAKASTRK